MLACMSDRGMVPGGDAAPRGHETHRRRGGGRQARERERERQEALGLYM